MENLGLATLGLCIGIFLVYVFNIQFYHERKQRKRDRLLKELLVTEIRLKTPKYMELDQKKIYAKNIIAILVGFILILVIIIILHY